MTREEFSIALHREVIAAAREVAAHDPARHDSETRRRWYRCKSAVAALDAHRAGNDPRAAWEMWADPKHPWPWEGVA